MLRSAAIMVLCALPVRAATPEARTVTYKTPDGVEIVADYYAPKAGPDVGAPIVILLHQYPSTRSSWRPLAPLFHEAGYAILAPDLRGHGDSVKPARMKLSAGKESRSPQHYREAYQDVLGAYEWLRSRKEIDRSRLAIVGASIGTSVAIDYAARDRSVDVVVCLSPGPNYFGVDSKRHITKYGDRPILLLSPSNEEERSRILGAENASVTVKIIKDSDLHGTFMFGKVPGIEKTVFEFVDTHIGKPSDRPVVASLKSKKDPDPTCRYATPDPDNRYAVRRENLRVFSSPAEAKGRGYEPCKKCFK